MALDIEIWSGLTGLLDSRGTLLASECRACWTELEALIATQRALFLELPKPALAGRQLSAIDDFFAGWAPPLLGNLHTAYNQKRPLYRVLTALQEHDAILGDAVLGLPRTVETSMPELGRLPGVHLHWRARLRRALRNRPRTVALRDAVADHLLQLLVDRAALDGAFQLVLAQALLHLLFPWQTYRRAFLVPFQRSADDFSGIEQARAWWLEAASGHRQRAESCLRQYDAWAGSFSAAVGAALFRRPRPVSVSRRAKWTRRHQRHLAYWSRQQRAVHGVMELELQLTRVGRRTVQDTIGSLESLQSEHGELRRELETAIGWLAQWPDTGSEPFPQPQTQLLSSNERLAEWLQRTIGNVRSELPATIESVKPHQATPGLVKPWRNLKAAGIFASALRSTGAPLLVAGFREAEAVDRTLVREIERAREVVAFALETAAAEPVTGQELAREAISNALSLLRYQQQAAPGIGATVDSAAVSAVAAVLIESDTVIEKQSIGLAAYLTRQRGRRIARQVRGVAAEGLRHGFRYGWKAAREANRWVLTRIGWLTPPRKRADPVVRRADLGDALKVQLHGRDLPMLYRRLFRLAPVEDPRFLVGRDEEMAGFADALARWEEGRGTSVIIVGARGSGKTSLVNCAIARIFTQCEVARGQFGERLIEPAGMTAFIGSLLGLAEGANPAEALALRRRVIVVEEFERTFLRAINGFDALRALLDLMYMTSRSTLWIFSVNETAYHYLDSVLGLGRHFSHHINAMSVKQEDLSKAILQRHGLSGARLEYAPLAPEDPRVSRLRHLSGLEQDAGSLFLDALYAQSEGIFRAAYELWQGSIERLEAGVVYMRQPLAPDYSQLAASMSLDDCFTLKAILQHGSLTADEVAQVLVTSPQLSVRQLERLHLLEVLEPEPGGSGVRVRPEAGRLVRDTLSRRNLI